MYALNYIYFISCKDTAEDESMKIDLKYTVFLNTVRTVRRFVFGERY